MHTESNTYHNHVTVAKLTIYRYFLTQLVAQIVKFRMEKKDTHKYSVYWIHVTVQRERGQLCCINLSSNICCKLRESCVFQNFHKCVPSNWFLAFSLQPFLQNLYIDLFAIVRVLLSNSSDSCSCLIVQEQDPKLCILCSYFPGDVDQSPFAMKFEQLG